MNYRDFFKKASEKDVMSLLPEGVAQSEFKRAIAIENKTLNNIFISAKIASENLREDAHYYKKIYTESGDEEEVEDIGNEYDENGGLPKIGGALAVRHTGQPIMMGKIIQTGGLSGTPATGELSGMTAAGASSSKGVAKDAGGLPVQQTDSKEQITAGGKAVDSSIASKTVGGAVVPGEGQKQGGLNSKGTIASTSKLNESKKTIRGLVKEVLKEIRFDKQSGKWVRINEKVNMKMGASYKVVQPTLAQTVDQDKSRQNQYEPKITEMYDDEEEMKLNERYVELANAQRNLSETELAELSSVREKVEQMQATRRNFGLSQGGTEPNLYQEDGLEEELNMKMGPSYKVVQPTLAKTSDDDFARQNQYDPHMSENDEMPEDKKKDKLQGLKCPECGSNNLNVLSPEEASQGGHGKSGGSAECNKCGHMWNTTDDEGNPLPPDQMGIDEARCEDYPCCGHEDGDCPGRDEHGRETWTCVGCGKTLPHGAPSSLCPKCQNKMSDLDREDPTGQDSENYFGMDEAGGGDVQHSSYRTVKHGNLPQDPKQRWENDISESESSKTAKKIAKGQQGKKSTFIQNLKHQKPKKTSSGVHKRKS